MPANTDGNPVTWGEWLRCKFRGHLWSVQTFDINTHEMRLICNCCRQTETRIIPRIRVSNEDMPHIQAEQH